MLKKALLLLSPLLFFFSSASAETFALKSPGDAIEVSISCGPQLTFSLSVDGKPILRDSVIAMETDRGIIGENATPVSSHTNSYNNTLKPVWGKHSAIEDNYRALVLNFGKWALEVRAYHDAFAYRFLTNLGDGQMTVIDEKLMLSGLDPSDNVIALTAKDLVSPFEGQFQRLKVGDMKPNENALPPFVFEKNGIKVALLESSRSDYPGLHIVRKEGSQNPEALFAQFPASLEEKGFYRLPKERAPYIAKTNASREFPWRAFVIARKDIDLINNNTEYKLAKESSMRDTSWIHPGISVWDWWAGFHSEGLDTPVGINVPMYEFYINFARDNKLPFITIDEGWHCTKAARKVPVDGRSYYSPEVYVDGKPMLDIPYLVKYAHSQGVKVMLWVPAMVFEAHAQEAVDLYSKWGVDALKIDLLNRDDQPAVKLIEESIALCAAKKIMTVWHGCPGPAGLHRTYPNAVNFEAVLGSEYNKFSKRATPAHNVDVVFLREILGPFDYTPGGMRNQAPELFASNRRFPNVMGSRAHTVAMYIAYYGPMQMLSDSPGEYKKAADMVSFISKVPTTWDHSQALEGELGKYIVYLRRKGSDYYIGGMNTEKPRNIALDLSTILPKGVSFEAQIIHDSVNSGAIPTDYRRKLEPWDSKQRKEIRMERNGGFAVRLTPVRE